MVVPFMLQHHEQWRGRQNEGGAPRLEIEAFDEQDRVVPTSAARPVLEILLSEDIRTFTRENVRLKFDDPNDGVQRTPPFDYDDVNELRGLTLRVLQDWGDETTDALFDPPGLTDAVFDSPSVTERFDRLYRSFESSFFSEDYFFHWFSPLSNLAFTHGGGVILDEDLLIRYLAPHESKELSERWRHVREAPPPRMALVQTIRIRKGARVDFSGRVPPQHAREKVVFCARALAPGGIYSDQLTRASQTCWGVDMRDSTFFRRALPSERAGNTVLSEHDMASLVTLWEAIRDRQDFNLRFLTTKLDDAYRRDSVLDRFADIAVALQHIFGSEGQRFAPAMAWALRGHRDSAARKEIYELAREVNPRRNAVLHGNTDRLKDLLSDVQEFSRFTDRAEHCLRQSLQLLLLNEDFRTRLDDAMLGAAVEFRRLPYTF